MYLTLPLPVQRTWEHTIHWVPYDVTKPHVKIPIHLHRDSAIKDVKLLLKKWMGTPVEHVSSNPQWYSIELTET